MVGGFDATGITFEHHVGHMIRAAEWRVDWGSYAAKESNLGATDAAAWKRFISKFSAITADVDSPYAITHNTFTWFSVAQSCPFFTLRLAISLFTAFVSLQAQCVIGRTGSIGTAVERTSTRKSQVG